VGGLDLSLHSAPGMTTRHRARRMLSPSALVAVLALAASAPVAAQEQNALASAQYEEEKKSEGGALAMEALLPLPGLGNLYAGDPQAAAVTFLITASGFGLALWGLSHADNGTALMVGAFGGTALGITGKIYGMVHAARAASAHNQALRSRLGLPPLVPSVTVMPAAGGTVAVGPALTFRF
jgi:hypothetical protein